MNSTRQSNKIVVCPATGDRLCYDNKWRSFAMFGDGSRCVKIFKYAKAAHTAARKYKHPKNDTNFITRVVYMYDGDSMDAAGHLTRADGKPAHQPCLSEGLRSVEQWSEGLQSHRPG